MDGRVRVILVVWWSMTGATRRMAIEAALGARQAARSAAGDGACRVRVRLVRASRAGPADVLGADAYLFATPEYLGAMAGMLKDFFDRCYYPVLDRVAGRAWAGIVCAGSDGQGAVRQLARIATGWRLREAASTIVACTHAQTPRAILSSKTMSPGDLAQARELGGAMAAALSLGIW